MSGCFFSCLLLLFSFLVEQGQLFYREQGKFLHLIFDNFC